MLDTIFPQSGLLGPDEQKSARNNLLLNFGLGLLANSDSGASFGQAAGLAGMGAMQQQSQYSQQQIQNKLAKQKIDEAQRQQRLPELIGKPAGPVPMGPPSPDGRYGMIQEEGSGLLGGKLPPEALYAEMVGMGPEYAKMGMAGLGVGKTQDVPAAVQEWEYLKKEFPKMNMDFPTYLGVKRQMYKVSDIGSVPHLVANAPGIAPTPLSTLANEVTGKSAIEGGKKAAEVRADAVTKAQLDLPTTIANGDYSIKLLEDLKNHPGLTYAVGAEGKIPAIPGTPQGDFIVRLDQLQGKQFLEAFNTLKGGGQITEIEGKKAQDAIARMSRAQSEESFKEAATEFQKVIKDGLERAKSKAGQSQTPGGGAQSNSGRIRFDANGKRIQ
jgi:hypothetical protein